MHYPAVLPALALVAGAALGIWRIAEPSAVAAALVLGIGLSLVSWRQRSSAAFVAAALFTFAVAGYALAVTASHRAIRSQLRSVLVEEAGPRAVSDAPGDTVILIGRLTADASPIETGVRLALDVQARHHRGQATSCRGRRAAHGGR